MEARVGGLMVYAKVIEQLKLQRTLAEQMVTPAALDLHKLAYLQGMLDVLDLNIERLEQAQATLTASTPVAPRKPFDVLAWAAKLPKR